VKELFGNRLTVEASTKQKTTGGRSYTSANGITYHEIRDGESLSMIARKYQVNVSDLKKWNNLNSNKIIAGKQLKILN
ncbi:Cell wall-binding protein YocH, partial [termite gut metagenome]